VRIEGDVQPVSDADADAYFATRPRQSQIGAWASMQSAGMGSRAELDARVHEVEDRFKGAAVTRPPFWSGFRVMARSIEFWKRDPARLHERVVYQRGNGQWTRAFLYP
jgi:pyridoxamine 5'-phosphate oxidase